MRFHQLGMCLALKPDNFLLQNVSQTPAINIIKGLHLKNHQCWPNGAIHRENQCPTSFFVIKLLRGQGWGSFETHLRDVGEEGTPMYRVALKNANCIDALCH